MLPAVAGGRTPLHTRTDPAVRKTVELSGPALRSYARTRSGGGASGARSPPSGSRGCRAPTGAAHLPLGVESGRPIISLPSRPRPSPKLRKTVRALIVGNSTSELSLSFLRMIQCPPPLIPRQRIVVREQRVIQAHFFQLRDEEVHSDWHI